MKQYNVWVTLFGSSAKNAGIVGGQQKTRSSWAMGKLEYVPVNDWSQQNFQFDAMDDDRAMVELTRLFNIRNPYNKRPLSGKSYLRECRQKKGD
jgi:hypothetical protein